MPFIPHTPEDIKDMLAAIGAHQIEELFDEIPPALLISDLPDIPPALNEMALARLMKARAESDSFRLSFLGAGAYEHHIPAAVPELISRGEWMTGYTPYQAEASQGTLQALYEYQTMMASLMHMEVSNASLYEGASALAEAVLMSVRLFPKKKRHRILVPLTVHPHYRAVLKTIIRHDQIELVDVPYDSRTGRTDLKAIDLLKENLTALVIPQPNFFGVLEEVDALTDAAQAANALGIAVVNPLAMALLKPPGQWGHRGADIACGEGQSLGVPLASGGPYYGFLCCRNAAVRQLPGRIVGQTRDRSGRPGFVLTLQAREQHIRRARATSNICTSQGLLVTASTIYMSLMGAEGLRRVALASCQKAHELVSRLSQIQGIRPVFSGDFFHECVLTFDQPLSPILDLLVTEGVQAGLPLQSYYPELGDALLVCATETKTTEDLTLFTGLLENALSSEIQGHAHA